MRDNIIRDVHRKKMHSKNEIKSKKTGWQPRGRKIEKEIKNVRNMLCGSKAGTFN